MKSLKKIIYLLLFLALTAAQGASGAVSTGGNNFSMLDGGGGQVGGTNNVNFTWDETFVTDVVGANSNATIDAIHLFFGTQWFAHDITLYGPGTYSFDSGCPAGFPECNAASVLYTPDREFNGSDSFSYTIIDEDGGVATATVNITVTPVNNAPTTKSDMIITAQDAGSETTINPLANDTDPEGDSLTVTGVDTTATTGGTVSFTANSVGYTPNAGFFGIDSFTYTADDGNGSSSSGTVNVAVNATGNTLPVCVNDAKSGVENSGGTVTFIKTNDSDADADALSILGATNGTNGTTDNPALSSNSIVYRTDKIFVGTDAYTYTLVDARGGTDTCTVNMTITSQNDIPISSPDLLITNQDAAEVTINPLLNDFDEEGDTLVVDSVISTATVGGTVSFTANSVGYTPNAGFSGVDSFTYRAGDGTGTSLSTKVTVAVNATGNIPPVAADNSYTIAENSNLKALVVEGRQVRADPVIGADTDPDSKPIGTVGFTSVPGNGTAVPLKYTVYPVTVPTGQVGAHMLFNWNGNNDIDLFNIWTTAVFSDLGSGNMSLGNGTADPWSNNPANVWDGASTDWDSNGVQSRGFVDGPFPGFNGNFNVMGVWANSVPVATDDTLDVIPNTPTSSMLVGTDSDLVDHPGTQTLTYSLGSTTATLGVVTIDDASTGAYTYTPNLNALGNDSFTFDVSDGVETDTGTINVTLNNAAPTAPGLVSPADLSTGVDGTAVPFEWTASTDADGNTISYDITVCEDAALTVNCVVETPVLASLIKDNPVMMAGFSGGASLLFLGLAAVNRRQRIQMGLVAITTVLLLSACSSSDDKTPPASGSTNPTATLTATLTAGTNYYWKVTASDGLSTTDSAEVWMFTTAP